MRDKLMMFGWTYLVAALTSTGLLLLGVAPARAELLAYEGFDYSAGTLLVTGGVGLGGGSGWAGPWDESQAASFSTAVQSTSLAYTDSLGNSLVSTGGKLLATGVDGTSQPGRTLSVRRASAESGEAISTWVSFVAQRIGEVNADGGQFDGTYRRGANLALFDLGGSASQPEKFNVGETSNFQYPLPEGGYEDRFQTRAPGINAAVIVPQPYAQNPEGSPTSNANGAQVRDAFSQAKYAEIGLVVMRIDHNAGDFNGTDNGGNDNIHVWVNPLLNAAPQDANASIKYIATDIIAAANAVMPVPSVAYQGTPTVPGSSSGGEFNFDRLRLFAGNVAGTTPYAQLLFDELRVGTSFADVAPFTPGVSGLPGDFNDDDKVDAADYTVWRDNLGAPTETALYGNGDGMNGVDAGDFTLWKSSFGDMAGAGGASAVPESTTALLLLLGSLGLTTGRRCLSCCIP